MSRINTLLWKTGFPALVLMVFANMAFAEEIYHWVDENGVMVYSQDPPPATVENAETLDLGDSVLSQDGVGVSEEDDPEGYREHREEMDALRADMESRREGNGNSQDAASSPEVVYHYIEDNRNYPLAFPARPGRPPHRPPPGQKPEPLPAPTATLKRP